MHFNPLWYETPVFPVLSCNFHSDGPVMGHQSNRYRAGCFMICNMYYITRFYNPPPECLRAFKRTRSADPSGELRESPASGEPTSTSLVCGLWLQTSSWLGIGVSGGAEASCGAERSARVLKGQSPDFRGCSRAARSDGRPFSCRRHLAPYRACSLKGGQAAVRSKVCDAL